MQWSSAYWACFQLNKHLFAGSPDSLTVLEDLALHFTVDELRDMFKQTVLKFKEKRKQDEGRIPNIFDSDFL